MTNITQREKATMHNLSTTLHQGFRYHFTDFYTRVHTLAADLTEEEFWQNPFPYGNSIGHLVLHLTGNLNYYLGTQLAATGYVRDRAREFTEAQPPTKAEALQALESAVSTTIAALEMQTDADWARTYSAVGVDDVPDRFSIFLRCAVHFHHHIGHISYTKDELLNRRLGTQSQER
ncbi:MAG: DinB family protein [Caldilineaceae bacterium]